MCIELNHSFMYIAFFLLLVVLSESFSEPLYLLGVVSCDFHPSSREAKAGRACLGLQTKLPIQQGPHSENLSGKGPVYISFVECTILKSQTTEQLDNNEICSTEKHGSEQFVALSGLERWQYWVLFCLD